MKIHALPKTVETSRKRLGRGHGSGRGKTSGRGTKGQKARGSIPPHFEGGQLSVMKRMPYLRGKARNKSLVEKAMIIKVGALNALPEKTTVTVESLQKAGLVESGITRVKVLDGGTLEHALSVHLPCSKGAREAIEKAGGSVA